MQRIFLIFKGVDFQVSPSKLPPLEMRILRCLEKSGMGYPVARHQIPEKGNAQSTTLGAPHLVT
jgi:hypothetical protein